MVTLWHLQCNSLKLSIAGQRDILWRADWFYIFNHMRFDWLIDLIFNIPQLCIGLFLHGQERSNDLRTLKLSSLYLNVWNFSHEFYPLDYFRSFIFWDSYIPLTVLVMAYIPHKETWNILWANVSIFQAINVQMFYLT